MTRNKDIALEPTWVAIDIAKRRNDILIQAPGKKRYRMTITNDNMLTKLEFKRHVGNKLSAIVVDGRLEDLRIGQDVFLKE